MAQIAPIAGEGKLALASDGRWFKRKAFVSAHSLKSGFALVAYSIKGAASVRLANFVRACVSEPNGDSVWQSARCPYTGCRAQQALPATYAAHGFPACPYRIESKEEARAALTPTAIFSAFLEGRMMTVADSVYPQAQTREMLTPLEAQT